MLIQRDIIALVIGICGAVVSTSVFGWTLYQNKRDISDEFAFAFLIESDDRLEGTRRYVVIRHEDRIRVTRFA